MGAEDLEAWTAAAAWVLAGGILFLWYWQTRQSHRRESARLLLELRDRFDAPKMRAARRSLSAQLLDRSVSEVSTLEVLVFFDLLGALGRRGAVDVDLVSGLFGGWVTNYYYAVRHPVDFLGRSRTSFRDPSIFAEFEWLNHRLLRLEETRSAKRGSGTSREQESREVLRFESGLDAD